MSLILNQQIGEFTITGTHAPHAEAPEIVKVKYYDKLRELHAEYGKQPNIHIIGGDFNVRLIDRSEAESDIIGPFIFNPNEDTLDILSEGQK